MMNQFLVILCLAFFGYDVEAAPRRCQTPDVLHGALIVVAVSPESRHEQRNGGAQVIPNSYQGGTVVKIACDKGYVVEGAIWSTCHISGEWSTQLGNCVKANFNYDDSHESTSTEQIIVTNNRTGEYSIEPVVAKQARNWDAQGGDTWGHYYQPQPVEEMMSLSIQCSVPEGLSDALMLWDRSSLPPPGSMYEPGTQLYFRCDVSATLYGPATLTCLGPDWDNDFPTCYSRLASVVIVPNNDDKEDCDLTQMTLAPYALEIADDAEGRVVLATRKVKNGRYVKLRCQSPATQMTGCRRPSQGQSACQVSCQQGQLQQPMPTCRPSLPPTTTQPACNPCQMPLGISSLLQQANGQRLPASTPCFQSIQLCCPSGYQLSGSSSVACMPPGGCWSGNFPTCQPTCQQCTVPGGMSPQLLQLDGSQLPSNVRCGQSLSLCCQLPGYQLSGPSVVSCIGPNFDRPFPTCQPTCSPCSLGQLAPHTRVIGLTASQYQCGQAVFFQCDQGYKLTGPASINCLGPTWDANPPTCTCQKCNVPASRSPFLLHQDGSALEAIGTPFDCGCQISLACQSGYAIQGSPTLTCLGPAWDCQWPTCTKICQPCAVPMNLPSNLQISGGAGPLAGYQCGQSITFQCPASYQLMGSQMLICNGPDWSGQFPSCQPICQRCQMPYTVSPYLQNSDGTPLDPVGTQYDCGCQLGLKCQSGYQLMGQTTVNCIGPNWDCSFPTCQQICQPCTLPNGVAGRPGLRMSGYQTTYQCGQSVRFTCDPNYQLIGASSVQCVGSAWSDNFPTCQPICQKCCLPSGLDPMLISADGSALLQSQQFDCGCPISLACSSGYQLIGASSVTCLGPNWDRAFPTCQCPQCSLPYGIPQNLMSSDGSMLMPGAQYDCGCQVSFCCQNGYVLQGASTLTCLGPNFDQPMPSCQCPQCSMPYNLSPYLMMADGSGQAPQAGAQYDCQCQIQLTCQQGYTLVGPPMITCNGPTWNSQFPTCVPTCQPCRIGNILQSTPGLRLVGTQTTYQCGDSACFTCDDNFQMTGSSSVQCIGPNWSAGFPTCTPICRQCSIPAYVSPALMQMDGTPMPSAGQSYDCGCSISLCCQQGYQLLGSYDVQCIGPDWSNPFPTCQKLCQQCTIPDGISSMLTQGDGSMLPSCGTPIDCGTCLDFSCPAGYRLSGPNSVNCVGPNWDNQFPSCVQICQPCQPPSGALNASPGLIVMGSKNSYQCGESIRFQCQSNYRLQGQSSIQCIGSSWSGSVPVCVPICQKCSIPPGADPNLADASTGMCLQSGKPYDCGQCLQLQCQTGFRLVGPAQMTCIGPSWDSANFPTCMPICQQCRIPSNLSPQLVQSNGGGRLVAGQQFDCNTQMCLDCQSGYQLVGASTLTCRGPNWDQQFPMCQPVCQACATPSYVDSKLTLQDGSYIMSSYDCGQSLSFCCPNGYNLMGASQVYCNGPDWTDSFPSCQAPTTAKPACQVPTNICNSCLQRPNGAPLRSGSLVLPGTRLFLKCRHRDESIVGSPVVRCLGPDWENPFPSCQ